MKRLFERSFWLLLINTCGIATCFAAEPIDYARDVRPILSQFCFRCHGPDEGSREAGLRLDLRESALKPAESGERAIVPNQPANSELLKRIESTDSDSVMPPPSTKKVLTATQKATLKRWIEAGAPYQDHWAFRLPQASPLPAVQQRSWPRNEIDRFVLAKLEAAGLQPAPQADPYTLLRRASLDLIGLPPTIEEADLFLKEVKEESAASDDSQGLNRAYERLIDRLLASPQYGERWARRWLDLARYADTNGYEKDRARTVWPYRDWVIKALNADMPFDQFTIEQLAGDMLPNATPQQRIATGFHRNTMLNEEGGIDPLEFRFYAMTDRVATTGTTWLGLTLGCAQCHSHKYDPLSHHDYYRFMAYLNNADEPDLELPDSVLETTYRSNLETAHRLVADLEKHWPRPDADWTVSKPSKYSAKETPDVKLQDDGSVLFAMPGPDRDEFEFIIETSQIVDRLKLEALTDASLPKKGPGRTPHGNFVLSEISVAAQQGDQPPAPVKLVRGEAAAQQEKFPIEHAFDGKPETGWAVQDPKQELNTPKTAVFYFESPIPAAEGTRLIVKLAQNHGTQHTLGRVRLSLGKALPPLKPDEPSVVDTRFSQWLARERQQTIAWRPLRPSKATSNMPLLTVQEDDSIFASGDTTKYDTYELIFPPTAHKIAAIRLEALPDERLPANGPGMTYYEGTKGDFFLSEFIVTADGKPVRIRKATDSYSKNRFGANPVTAQLAVDGDPQTGWSVDGRIGERHTAVFVLETPVEPAKPLHLKMTFGRHFASSLGRFRLSTTDAERDPVARDFSPEIERLLARDDTQLSADERQQLRTEFLLRAPELKAQADRIRQLRQKPAGLATLVLQERPSANPRPTYRQHRGEFLQPRDQVHPGLPPFLPQPKQVPRNRLDFARWLVSAENPLTARVTVNRQWAAFFGNGLVRSQQDFGLQGDLPTHPELLDWLAVHFRQDGWSLKRLHKLIVMSSTYQQTSQLRHDGPEGSVAPAEILARGPRVRLESEIIRDSVLRVAGLLSSKQGGPSVFPPQPASVTTEGTYGAITWTTSTGEDRYRRSLYTFTKRTAPFAMTLTFDGPSGEACIARRDVSNTPLQALTLLNDGMFHEAAQSLGKAIDRAEGTTESKIALLFRRCFTRPPEADELAELAVFLRTQKGRFENGSIKAADVTSDATASADQAAWTVLIRALLNVDEFVVKD